MAASSGAETANGGAAAGAAGPVSFGFSRKAERRRVLAAGPCAEPGGGGSDDDTEPLTAVEDRELRGTRPAPPPRQELVIPLLPSRRWPHPQPPPADTGPAPADTGPAPADTGPAPAADHAPGPAPNSVEAQAVQELLQEARQSQERGEGPPGAPSTIPLSLQEGSVAPRPQPGPQDYAAVPVEAFGLAMLRGMGWSQGEGIGRTFKRVVKPLEQPLRPRGLGLGAAVAPPGAAPPPSQPPRGGGEPGGGGALAVGATVRVTAGPHRGMEGQVEGLDPETARALVRLRLGGQVVTISQHGLRAPSPPGSGPPSRKPEGGGAEDGPDDRAPPQRGEGKRKQPPPTERAVKQPRGAPPAPPPPWLRRDLRVRCVDRTFRAGRYYNCKMVVEDMVSPDTCVCRTDEGLLVEGLQEAMLETVIPRGEADRVMVVLGEHAGRVGRILEREPGRSRALVQLERDEAGRVVPLDYDAVCHYLGGHEDD